MLFFEIYFCVLILLPFIGAPHSFWKHAPNAKPGIKVHKKLPSNAIIVRMTKIWNNDLFTTELFLKRKFNQLSQNNHCNYIGHVQGASNVSIAALTGCIGKQNVYTTITTVSISDDWSSWSEGSRETLLWKLDGEVEEIEENNVEIMDFVENDELKMEVFDMDVLKSLNVSKLNSNILTVL